MMPLADLAQLAIAGKNRVAGRRRIVIGESIILPVDDGDGHDALQVSAGRAAPAVLPCPQALPRPIARFAERRSGCGPQVRHRRPEGAQVSSGRLIREQTTGPKAALLALLSQPFGFALLGLVAFGLLCFAVWRIAQSILDSDRLLARLGGARRFSR